MLRQERMRKIILAIRGDFSLGERMRSENTGLAQKEGWGKRIATSEKTGLT